MAADEAEPRIEDTEFFSGPGMRLSARIYHPPSASDEALAGVVFCHGFGGTKEGTPVGLSRLLALAGYRVMTFDYRGFGDADGPMGRLVPSERVEDAQTALEWFAGREDVDAGRIALYGTSYGGSTVISVARHTSIPRCVVATVPLSSGSNWLRSLHRPYEFDALLQRARAAVRHKALTGEMEMVERNDLMPMDMFAGHDAGLETINAADPVPMALETMIHVMRDQPIEGAAKIKVPVMLIAMREDHETPLELAEELYEQLTCPKRFVVFPKGTHISVYMELLDATFRETSRWFAEHLVADAGPAVREA